MILNSSTTHASVNAVLRYYFFFYIHSAWLCPHKNLGKIQIILWVRIEKLMESRQDITPPTSLASTAKESMTAFSILLATWRASQQHPHLFNDTEHALLNAFIYSAKSAFPMSGPSGYLLTSIFYSPRQLQTQFFNRVVFPYYDDAILMRKLIIKTWLKNKVADNFKQIIVLGDGFDLRGLMMGIEDPSVQVFALDRDPTHKHKVNSLLSCKNILNGHELTLQDNTLLIDDNIRFIEYDANKANLHQCLLTHGFNPNKRTVVLMEGFGMYVTQETLKNIIGSLMGLVHNEEDIKILVSMKSKITYTATQENAQKQSGELYQSSLRPEEAIDFFSPFGEITGKFTPRFHLHALGNHEGQRFYEEDKKKPFEASRPYETYYEITKTNNPSIDHSIDEVKELTADILPKPEVVNRWCNIL